MDSILNLGVRQRSAVYVLTVVGAFIAVLAIVYYTLSQILGPVQILGRNLADSVGGVNNTYIGVDQFLTGLFSFILTFAIFAIAQYVWIYQQRKPGGYYG